MASKFLAAWITLSAGLVLGGPQAPADPDPRPEITERRIYYDVDAVRVDALRAQLDDGLLHGGEAGGSAGRTLQWLEASYELEPTPEGCRLARIQVRVDITIHLPRWVAPEPRPAGLQARWDRMLEALTRHEQGHRDRAVAAAYELLRRLRALPPEADCRALARAARGERLRVELAYRDDDAAYDRRTRNGVAQGSEL